MMRPRPRPLRPQSVRPQSVRTKSVRTQSRGTRQRGTQAGGPSRVLLVVESLPLAGDARLLLQAEALLADGFEVTVICRRDPRNKSCLPGVRVLEYPAPPEGSGPLAFTVEYAYSLTMATLLASWELARHGFDIVQIGSPPDIYFVLTAPLRWLGVPVVFDFRDPSPETYAARYDHVGGLVYRALLRLEWYCFRTADRVLVVNDSLHQIAHGRGGIDHEQIATVGCGPPIPPDGTREPVPWLQDGRPHMCCFVGKMGRQDSVDLALHAIAELVHGRKRTDCSFAFVGRGDAVADARRLAVDLGISDFVSFPGWAQEALVRDYLVTADLGIEPNTEDYISPVKVMDYMSAGLPVVAFEARETVQLAADAARYAPAGDVQAMAALIDELLDSAPTRAQMGHAGRTRFRSRIAWEHQAVRYLAVFRDLASQRSRKTRRSASAARRQTVRNPGPTSRQGPTPIGGVFQ
jgi:glycosyltransferase involved in cell wall biosynthesis